MDIFYKDMKNQVEIQEILEKYDITREKEYDIYIFDDLITNIVKDHPHIYNLDIVLERILVYLVKRIELLTIEGFDSKSHKTM